MTRKNGSPQKAAMRKIMRNRISVLLEGALDEELGYSKYDYKNKNVSNSRNGYFGKIFYISYGDMDAAILVTVWRV